MLTQKVLEDLSVNTYSLFLAALLLHDTRTTLSVSFVACTGGTELDDWPGGIKQKYLTMRPMVAEMLKVMGWSKDAIAQKNFIGYQDDAIGVWKSGDVAVCCFATPEVCHVIKSWASGNTKRPLSKMQ